MKTLCSVHRLFYNGSECPICRQERMERYSQRFYKEKKADNKPVEEEKREITTEDLNNLLLKFNNKKK